MSLDCDRKPDQAQERQERTTGVESTRHADDPPGYGGFVAEAAQQGVEELLVRLEGGDRAAFDQLFTLVYEELSELAHRLRTRWKGDHTLNTTALIHEGYLKLLGQSPLRAESRAHFLAVAAKVMRHVLINYARDRRARKRGGDRRPLQIEDLDLTQPAVMGLTARQAEELLALHEALEALGRIDARQSQVVECRFFGGLSVDETAEAMRISPRTVKRDWALAQAWLQRQMDLDASS
jgi:RNA polymerase sigma factor (TIGR02999 family)